MDVIIGVATPGIQSVETLMAARKTGPRPSIRCFVAMAFDHDDTDAMFQQIESGLSGVGISLRRVDRIEHNDDIDDKIISEINEADFVIADLTYARPSVYFEAGYAQARPVPVVYTARRDHFRPRDDDPHGNLRVHFDLQMRNIIAWAKPGDPMFLKRLQSRISKVISPILKQKRADADAKDREATFINRALAEQLDVLRSTAQSHFERVGFEVTEVDSYQLADPSIWNFDVWAKEYFRGAILGIKRAGTDLRMIFFHPVKSIDKKLCQQYRYKLVGMRGSRDLYEAAKWEPKRVVLDIVLCVLRGSNAIRRLSMEIPYLRPGSAEHSLVHESTLIIDRLPSSQHSDRQFHVTIHVIESTRSLSNLEQQLIDRIPK